MLSNELIMLRALEPEDLDILYVWENDTAMWEFGNNIAPFSHKLLSDYIANYEGDIYKSKQLRFIIMPIGSETPVGMVDLYDFDAINRRAGVGIMIDTAHQSKGYAQSALSLLGNYCYQRLGMHQLYAIIATKNKKSISAFERSGFYICGKLRSWIRDGEKYKDALIMQRLLANADET